LECDELPVVLLTFGIWADLPEFARLLELLVLEDPLPLLLEPDDLLELLACDELLE
jgi:hypothetical protein